MEIFLNFLKRHKKKIIIFSSSVVLISIISSYYHSKNLNKELSILTENEIQNGWSSNPNDYRTTCSRCQMKFVASFKIIIHGENGEIIEEKTYYHLSHAILTKEITNLLKKDVTADVSLFENHPIIFWNIITHLRNLKVPLNFLLPRVDWKFVVNSVTHPHVKTEASKLRIRLSGGKRKSLPESSSPSPTSSDEQDQKQRDFKSHSNPDTLYQQQNEKNKDELSINHSSKRNSADTPPSTKKNSYFNWKFWK